MSEYLIPLLMGGSSIYGAMQNRSSANTQANALQQAAQLQAQAQAQATNAQTTQGNNSLNFLRYAYDQSRADTAPWREAGASALPQAQQQFAQPFQESPGYDFARSEGIRGIQNGMASRGLLNSTAAARNMARFSTGLAQQDYGNYANRLMGLANMGSGAAGMGAQAANNYGSGAANVSSGMGNSLANIAMMGGQQQGNLMGQIGGVNAAGANAGASALMQGANGLLGYWSQTQSPMAQYAAAQAQRMGY